MWMFSEIIYSPKLEKNGEALGQENISQVDKMNYNDNNTGTWAASEIY